MQFYCRNVNYALYEMTDCLLEEGDFQDSRNGPVLAMPTPTTLTTANPMERVLLCPVRRANPFLNLLDGLSVFSMVDLVKPFADIVPRFKNYSDDGKTLRAHYGKRISYQLHAAIDMLRRDPNSRRVVISIWNKAEDLDVRSVDIPCNVMVVPRIVRGDRLDLTVFNRSNDMFWGMLGANIVQFSFLQEYMARMLGKRVGELHQISTNLHAYTEFGPGRVFKGMEGIDDERWQNPFTQAVEDYPPSVPLDLVNLKSEVDQLFMALAADEEPKVGLNTFLNNVVHPMLLSWKVKSAEPLERLPTNDWFEAAKMWWKNH